MFKTKFVSNCLAENIEDVKIAALYFDQIDVVNQALYFIEPQDRNKPFEQGGIGIIKGIKEFVTPDFKNNLKLLEENNVLNVIEEEKKSDLHKMIDEQTYRILDEAREFIYEESDIVFDETGRKTSVQVKISPEAIEIHNYFVNPIEMGKLVDFSFLLKYYSGLLSSLLFSMAIGDQTITSSTILNNYIKYNYKNNEIIESRTNMTEHCDISSKLAIEAIKVALPDVSSFSIEDILEMRFKLNDELLSFRDEMNRMQLELLSDLDLKFIHMHTNEVVNARIKPSIDELKRKLTNSKINVSQKLINELKDPKSYTPLLGTVFNQIPFHLATLMSAGIIGISSALDYIKSQKEIKDNGLYYLISLNKYK